MNPAGALRIAVLGAALLGLAATALVAARAEIPLDQRRSSYDDMSRDTKAMQDDDTSNPAMLSVLDGEALWNARAGTSGKSCADCHGDARSSMKGVAARYPAFDEAAGHPVNIEQRINLSRERNQKATPFRFESAELLALTAYIALQSRGEPIAPSADSRLEPFRRTRANPVQSTDRAVEPVLRAMPRRQLGQEPCGQFDSTGPSDRISDLPAGMAEPWFTAAASAKLHDRRARGALPARRDRICRTRIVPDVARARYDDGKSGRATMNAANAKDAQTARRYRALAAASCRSYSSTLSSKI